MEKHDELHSTINSCSDSKVKTAKVVGQIARAVKTKHVHRIAVGKSLGGIFRKLGKWKLTLKLIRGILIFMMEGSWSLLGIVSSAEQWSTNMVLF
jgi:hypothetical protein